MGWCGQISLEVHAQPRARGSPATPCPIPQAALPPAVAMARPLLFWATEAHMHHVWGLPTKFDGLVWPNQPGNACAATCKGVPGNPVGPCTLPPGQFRAPSLQPCHFPYYAVLLEDYALLMRIDINLLHLQFTKVVERHSTAVIEGKKEIHFLVCSY